MSKNFYIFILFFIILVNLVPGPVNAESNPLLPPADGDLTVQNWSLLIDSLMEGINPLGNLKIDKDIPNQGIIKIFKTFALFKGLPLIPVFNGDSIVNYDLSLSQKMINKWQNISNETFLNENLSNKNKIDNISSGDKILKEKELLSRLMIFSKYLGKSFEKSLEMSESCSMSLYKTCILVFTGESINRQVFQKYEEFPVIGKLFNKIRHRITARMVEFIKRTALFASLRVKQPFSEYIPLTTHLTSCYYLWTKKDSYIDELAQARELGARVAGKYLFSNIPRYGFVPLTQKFLDKTAVNCANIAHDSITMINESLWNKILNDLDDTLESSSLEQLSVNCKEIDKKVKKAHKSAGTAQAVANIAEHIDKYDPTCISRVVSVVSGGISGGFLLHSAAISANGFIDIIRGVQTAEQSIFPELVFSETGNTFKDIDTVFKDTDNSNEGIINSSANLRSILKIIDSKGYSRTLRDYSRALSSILRSIEKGDDIAVKSTLEDFLDISGSLESSFSRIEAQNLFLKSSTSSNQVFESLNRITEWECRVLGDTMAFLINPNNEERRKRASINVRQAISRINISSRFLWDNLKRESSIESGPYPQISIVDSPLDLMVSKEHILSIKVTNMGTKIARNIKLAVFTGGALNNDSSDVYTIESLEVNKTKFIDIKITPSLRDGLKSEGTVLSVIATSRNENNRPVGKTGFEMKYFRIIK